MPAPSPSDRRKAVREAAQRTRDQALLPPPTREDTASLLRKAKDQLQRRALSNVRRLLALTTEFNADPTPCPACGRGMLRDEELRLKAVLAALDRAGVGPAKVAPEVGEGSGPALIFPEGTRIAVLAGPTREEASSLGTVERRAADVELVRADRFVARDARGDAR